MSRSSSTETEKLEWLGLFAQEHQGPSAVVRAELKEKPMAQTVFVFINHANDRIKLLY